MLSISVDMFSSDETTRSTRSRIAGNNSSTLLELIDCPRYLISTNGSRHHHPDPAALARVLDLYDGGVELYFNYRSDETSPWADPQLRRRHRYDVFYPDDQGVMKVVV